MICLQETWLADDADASLLQLNDYTLVFQGSSVSRHRGVGYYVKSSLPHVIRHESVVNPLWEALFIEVTHPMMDKPIVIGSVYRAPNSLVTDKMNFIEEFYNVISNLSSLNKHIIICGDFNLNLLKLNTDNCVSQFYNNLTSLNFDPLITFPTRFTDNTFSLIDNIFFKSTHCQHPTSGILTIPISDHQLYFTLLPLSNFAQRSKDRFSTISHRKHNFYELIRTEFTNLQILNEMQHDLHIDPTYNYELLENALTTLINKHTSIKTVKLHKHKHKKSPWITQGIIKSIKFRDKLHLKLKKTRQDSPEYNTYKINLSTYNKILKKTIKQAKQLHYHNLFNRNQSNSKETWKHLNKLLNRKQNNDIPIEQLKIDENKTSNSQSEISNHFNHFFSTIGQTTAYAIQHTNIDYKQYFSANNIPSFGFSPIDNNEIEKNY